MTASQQEQKQLEIDQAAERLALALKDTDHVMVDQTLHRVRSMALPPLSEEENNTVARVLDARAAQRSVALYRTEARLYSCEADRTQEVLKRLECAHLASDEKWRHSVIDPVKKNRTRQIDMARRSAELAEKNERDFMKLREIAHVSVANLMLREERQYNHEFDIALSVEGGIQAAANVNDVISRFGQLSADLKRPRQTVPNSFQPASPDYLKWLRSESSKALSDTSEASFGSLVQDLAKECNGIASIAPLKGYERTVQKAKQKYSGDYSQVFDLIRGMVVFDNIPDLAKALDKLAHCNKEDTLRVIRAKDRLSQQYNASQHSSGYRDCLLNIQLRTGGTPLVTELQLHLASFLKIKNGKGHEHFEAARNIHMFDNAFTTRTFIWEPDTEEQSIDELLREIKEGVITRLTLDYSTGLWSKQNQQKLAEALQDVHCSLLEISLRSCRCGDDFIKICLPEEYIESAHAEREPILQSVRLGSLLHEGTAGRISRAGIEPLLRYLNGSIRKLDLEGCLDLNWNENCGDEVVETIAEHVDNMVNKGKRPLPQLQELNLKSTGLTEKGAARLSRLREEGKLQQLKVVHMDDVLSKSPE